MGLIFCVKNWSDTFCITYLFYWQKKVNWVDGVLFDGPFPYSWFHNPLLQIALAKFLLCRLCWNASSPLRYCPGLYNSKLYFHSRSPNTSHDVYWKLCIWHIFYYDCISSKQETGAVENRITTFQMDLVYCSWIVDIFYHFPDRNIYHQKYLCLLWLRIGLVLGH